MSLTILKEDEFTSFIEKCKEHSFMQTVSMSNLLKKRGFETKYLGWKSNNEITVAAIACISGGGLSEDGGARRY